MLSIAIDSEIERHLEALGARTAESKAKMAQERLLEALKEDYEDREWIRLAEERLARPEKSYPLSEVVQDLDLDS